MKEFIKSLKAFILFSILLGLGYPIFVTITAQLIAPYKANGSLIVRNGIVIGSVLIGQYFNEPKYFQSRPSAVNYNASNSGASNFGPSNKIFINQVAERIKEIKNKNVFGSQTLPADMVLCSGSGLDPHISLKNALIQANRISKLMNIPIQNIKELIDKNTDHNFIGLWGYEGINVLKLNIDLDKYIESR